MSNTINRTFFRRVSDAIGNGDPLPSRLTQEIKAKSKKFQYKPQFKPEPLAPCAGIDNPGLSNVYIAVQFHRVPIHFPFRYERKNCIKIGARTFREDGTFNWATLDIPSFSTYVGVNKRRFKKACGLACC